MSMFGKINVTGIYTAKDVTAALKAYNRCCETCLQHGCTGEYCAATKAMVNVTHRREFSKQMENPEIRGLVESAMDMG